MLKRHHELVRATLLISDAFATALAFGAAFLMRFHSGLIPLKDGVAPSFETYLGFVPLIVIVSIVMYRINGLYEARRIGRFTDEFLNIVKATIASLLVIIAVAFFLRLGAESRVVIALFAVFNPLFLGSFRGLLRTMLWNLRRRGLNQRHACIIGTGNLGQQLAERIQRNSWAGLNVRGFIEAGENAPELSKIGEIPVLGHVKDLQKLVKKRSIDQVFVALPFDQSRLIREIAETLSRETIAVTLVPDILEFVTLKASAVDFDGLALINLSDRPVDGMGVIAKRILDIVVAIVGLLVFAIPMLIIGLLIWITDGRPIFYRQERMGLDGRHFQMIKFRTMCRNAEANSGPVWAKEHDPRVSKLGRWLRRLSFDELPQLWNVLRGEMSIVGPRPERPVLIEEFKQEIPGYMLRHAMKAGITGWAQINGWRGDTSLKKRLQYDLYYIENWSFFFDVKIILFTFVKGFYNPNAY